MQRYTPADPSPPNEPLKPTALKLEFIWLFFINFRGIYKFTFSAQKVAVTVNNFHATYEKKKKRFRAKKILTVNVVGVRDLKTILSR